MNTFQITWIIAGALMGYVVPPGLFALGKVQSNFIARLCFAFVGGLIAYTIVR